MIKMDQHQKMQKMQKIANALDRVDADIYNDVMAMARGMSIYDIAVSFNQGALDFFDSAIKITTKKGLEGKYKFGGYKNLFETALKGDKTIPVDKFTFLILEFAPDIYEGNEKMFLDMEIPDGSLDSGNEFNLIQSKEFKDLWRVLRSGDKEEIKDCVTVLTTYSHAYFLRLLLDINK